MLNVCTLHGRAQQPAVNSWRISVSSVNGLHPLASTSAAFWRFFLASGSGMARGERVASYCTAVQGREMVAQLQLQHCWPFTELYADCGAGCNGSTVVLSARRACLAWRRFGPRTLSMAATASTVAYAAHATAIVEAKPSNPLSGRHSHEHDEEFGEQLGSTCSKH